MTINPYDTSGGPIMNRSRTFRFVLGAILLIGLVVITARHAEAACDTPATSNTICYRGFLADFSATPSVTRTITFTIYDAATGGVQKWQETQSNITITFGRFAVELGTGTPFAADFHNYVLPRWLGTWISGEASERTPREDFTSAPSALRAKYAESIESVPASRITGTVSSATTAETALSVPASGISGTVLYSANSGTAQKVPAGGIIGTIAYASSAGTVPANGITGTVLYSSNSGTAQKVPASGIIGTVAYASSAGTAGSVPASGITGLISTSKLAPNSVTSAIIADGAVGSMDLASSAVTSSKLANGAVTSAKIAAGAVGNAALSTSAVTANKLSVIHGARVECNGGCGDSTLGQICDGLVPGMEPVSVTCTRVKPFSGGYSCGGNNVCVNVLLNRTSLLNSFCEDVDGADAVVFCMGP